MPLYEGAASNGRVSPVSVRKEWLSSMKWIHCADLHLGSRVETNLTAEKARERKAQLLQTFGRMIDFAAENEVRAVLLAGDVFDTCRPSVRTCRYVLDQIRRRPEIDFLYLRGNHDETVELEDVPENLILFGDSWVYRDYGEVTVAGIELSARSRGTLYDTLSLNPDRCNLVMLHGQESRRDNPDDSENLNLNRLRGKGIDYLALGHIHQHREEKLDDRGIYVYSGCLDGRGFDECGEKGFVLVETGGGRVHTQFVPFSSRVFHEVRVDAGGTESFVELLERVKAAAADIPARDIVKVVLTGACSADTPRDLVSLTRELEDRFYAVKCRDETKLAMDIDGYKDDISLKGEFIRLALAAGLSEEDCGQVIRYGLRALSGEEIEE